MAIQNGKKPISSKAKPTPMTDDNLFGNPLSLDPTIIKAIEAKGWAYRFVNGKQMQNMGGYHANGWRPVRMKDIRDTMEANPSDNQSFLFGSDPEGYIRRGDMVLAIRPIELNERHRAHLREKAQRASAANSVKAQAEEMRRFLRNNNLKETVSEGYDDETE